MNEVHPNVDINIIQVVIRPTKVMGREQAI